MIRSPSRVWSVLATVLLLGPAAGAAHAQHSTAALQRLSPQNRYQIEMLMDSAAQLGLPPDALMSKTLEGIGKGAPGARIVQVVRRHLGLMREARATLGDEITLDELGAAAGALQAGVPRNFLATLRNTRKGNSLLMPLVVISDLVSRGVPPDDASSAILALSQRGALDSDFAGLRRGVETDILSGAPPAAALDRRTREFPGRGVPGTRLPTPTPPRPQATSSPS